MSRRYAAEQKEKRHNPASRETCREENDIQDHLHVQTHMRRSIGSMPRSPAEL